MNAFRVVFRSGLLTLAFSSLVCGQSPRVLYTWAGTGNAQGWTKPANFGVNEVTIENSILGELTVTETGEPGTTFGIADDANTVSENGTNLGGLDLTGLDAIEWEIGHDGDAPVNVQFFVQATPLFTFIALGPDVEVAPGMAVYSTPLDGLALDPAQIAYIRVIGINVRDHIEQGNLVWTIREVRSAGEPLKERYFATHDEGSPDNGLQGAIVNFENGAVEGNDGGQNQSGLRHNQLEPPAGNTGSLQWTDLAGMQGAAVTWANGTVFNGNTFNERPTDMSNYSRIVLRIAATNAPDGTVASVGVQYFLQTGNWNFRQGGTIQNLAADGQYYDLEFPITDVRDLDFVLQHGVNIQNHADGNLIIDVDHILAVMDTDFPDCNKNGKPDEQDLASGASKDCNSNSLPDECDIAAGSSKDCNANAIPDDCDIAAGPRIEVIYTWSGIGDPHGWMKLFGAGEVIIDNTVEGELSIVEASPVAGTSVGVSDGFNLIGDTLVSQGALDLTGRSALEVEIGHDGTGPIQVQFFSQTTPDFVYVALGPDLAIQPDVQTVTLPLDGLTGAQIIHVKTIGLNIRDHLAVGDVTWTIREIRSVGVPLRQRDFAAHEAGASDNGLQGAVVSAEFSAVENNDNQQNQSGLSHNTSASPPGNTGSLQWTDVPGFGGGQVAWFNGTVWRGSTLNERTTDMSSFSEIVVRIAATNLNIGAVSAVDVQYFVATGNFNPYVIGPEPLPADGEFHELRFSLDGIPGLRAVDAHGLDLGEHAEGHVIIDVDNIRGFSNAATDRDCNGNGVPDDCDIAAGDLADEDKNGKPDVCEFRGFRRGDVNSDGTFDLTDPIGVFNYLFLGGEAPSCLDTADATDDGEVDISDGIGMLNRLFLGADPLLPPGSDTCGVDPTVDKNLECLYPQQLCR